MAQNNQKDNEINVNTKGYQFSNKDGFDPSTFTFGYWNDMISLRINPALAPDKQTENKIFDYEKTVSTSLTLEKAMTLMTQIVKNVIPAIEKEEEKSVGVQVGGDSLVMVGTTKKYNDKYLQYIAIHKSINPETKIPEMSIFYEFKKIDSIVDFNESTGEYSVEKNILSEFELFMVLLKNSILALGNANAHSINNVNKWRNRRIDNTVNSIAEKNGISTSSGYNNSYRKPVSWNNKDNDSKSVDNVDITEITNIEDISNYLE